MARAGNRGARLREEIAQLAARLIAEDGIQDFGTAKRKAAERLGVTELRTLPGNAEVEEALRVFRDLYGRDEHPEVLRALRTQAVEVMRRLERFNPYLTGSVLSGTAGRYSDITLQLYTESPKDVEFFLLNEGVNYRSGERRVSVGGSLRTVPAFILEGEPAEVTLVVYATDDLRVAARVASENGAPGRARAEYVEALLRDASGA